MMTGKNSHHQNTRAGFTLVEVSVVVVIISLLVGGIIAGTSLLRSARVKSIMEDKQQYQNAVKTFQDKYKALPGDMHNATEFWGAENTNHVTCERLRPPNVSTTKKTCNGDGNGEIMGQHGATWYTHEMYRFWQHLSNAGMIAGQYSGVIDCNVGNSVCVTPGYNTPSSQLRNATFMMAYQDTTLDVEWRRVLWLDLSPHHVLYFGGTIAAFSKQANSNPFQPILTSAEAWSIDTKFDDGKPGLGKTRAIPPINNIFTMGEVQQCASSTTASSATYRLDLDDIQCSVFFTMDF